MISDCKSAIYYAFLFNSNPGKDRKSFTLSTNERSEIMDQGKSLMGRHCVVSTALTCIFNNSKVETKKTDLVKHFHKVLIPDPKLFYRSSLISKKRPAQNSFISDRRLPFTNKNTVILYLEHAKQV